MDMRQVIAKAVYFMIIYCVWVNTYAQQGIYYQRINQVFRADPLDTAYWESWVNTYYERQLGVGTQLVISGMRESPGGYHYEFQHVWNGYSIENSGIKLTLDKSGQAISTMCDIQAVSGEVVTRYRWDSESLVRRLEDYLRQDDIYDFRVDTCYVKNGEQVIPAWKIILMSHGSSGSEIVYVDARNGIEMKRIDRAMYYHALQDTKALARVFLPDPCTRGRVRYGELFEDHDDAHDPVFDDLMDTVVLEDIYWDGDTFRLTGPYVEIADISPRNISPAVSDNGTFFFTRDNPGFEDVMVYYHIDRYQRYIQSLGFTNLQNRPMRVDPHGLGFSDQSQFVPSGDQSYIRFGEGGVDDAEDTDVIVHEYVHALSYAASGNDQMSCERRGLDEGIADYFAAGYSKDIDEYDWENIYNWDGHNPFYRGRMVVSNERYPLASCSKIENVNDWGEIWASAAMRIRNEIGNIPADRIFLQALYGNTNSTGFRDAALLVLEADSLLYGGQYHEWITFHFCQQGILEGAGCLSVGTGEVTVLSDDQLLIHTFAREGAVGFTWNVYQGGASQIPELTLELFNILGQRKGRYRLSAQNDWFEKIFLPPGIYAYHIGLPDRPIKSGKFFVPKP